MIEIIIIMICFAFIVFDIIIVEENYGKAILHILLWMCIVVGFTSFIVDIKIEKIEQGKYKIDSIGYRYDSQTKDTIILYKLNKR